MRRAKGKRWTKIEDLKLRNMWFEKNPKWEEIIDFDKMAAKEFSTTFTRIRYRRVKLGLCSFKRRKGKRAKSPMGFFKQVNSEKDTISCEIPNNLLKSLIINQKMALIPNKGKIFLRKQ